MSSKVLKWLLLCLTDMNNRKFLPATFVIFALRLASITIRMTGNSSYRNPLSALGIVLLLAAACDDKELESSKVKFSGAIRNSNFEYAANTPFRILVRTNPDIDPDTTISVRIAGMTDSNGAYNFTVGSDGFPSIPFYAVVPVSDTVMSLQFNGCLGRLGYTKMMSENINEVHFGAASLLKIVCNKIDESAGHTLKILDCSSVIQTTLAKPDNTFYLKLPYDFISHPHSLFYVILYPDFSSETRNIQVDVQPYDTTTVFIDY